MKVATLSGKAECGKTTMAELVKEFVEADGGTVCIVNYADYLKFIAKQYFGWNGKKDEEGRHLLQWLGTDKVRTQAPDFWVNIVANLLEVVLNEFDLIMITDTRFPNEISVMKERFDAISFWIERPNHVNILTPEQRLHPSETALDGKQYMFDYTVINREGIQNGMGLAKVMADKLYCAKQIAS